MDILFQPQRLIDIRIHSWCCVFMDLYEQIIECIHCLQCITQNSFYYKKNLYQSTYLSLSISIPGNHSSFLLTPEFYLSQNVVSFKPHRIQPFQTGFFHSVI